MKHLILCLGLVILSSARAPAQIAWMNDKTKPDIMPVVIKQVPAEFSEEARRDRFSGTVQVLVRVDETGHVAKAAVTRGVGHGLDEKAVEAVRQYLFKPGMKEGAPVDCNLYIDVRFFLVERR